MHRRVDPLHREVGALDDAHLDRRPALGPALGRPLLQVLHRAERVRQVRLQDDAGLEVGEGLEDRLEDRDRQVEVVVLLHVEVDERRLAGRRALVERRQLLDDAGDGLVERPHRQLAGDGRHLDRHVVDVVALEQLHRAVAAVRGLALAEDRLAEQVEVEPVAAGAQALDRLAELRGTGVDDEVADHAPQGAPGDRHDQLGEQDRRHRAELEQDALAGRQERRRVQRERPQVARGDPVIVRAYDAVDEPDRELEPVRVLEQLGEAFGGGIGTAGGRALGIDPGAYELDAALGESEFGHVEPKVNATSVRSSPRRRSATVCGCSTRRPRRPDPRSAGPGSLPMRRDDR